MSGGRNGAARPEDVEMEMLPISGFLEDGTLENPPKEPCCSITNCLLCGFGCATCCCLRNLICRRMVFAPPSPPFYFFKDKEMWRIPIEIYDAGSEFTSAQFQKIENKILDIQTFKIPTKRNKEVACVYVTHPDAKTTILFSHGNAADIGIMSFHFELMAETLKVNVYGYDYTGYGESSDEGKPSPKDVFSDAEAAYSHLTTQLNVDPKTIIFYGQSLGSGPSIYLGKKYPVCGVVIHSGLMSAVRVINPYVQNTPWYDVFANIDNIKDCQSPVYIIHGEDDKIIPVYHGIRLFRMAPVTVKPWFVPNGDHNDIELDFEQEYFLRLKWAIQDFASFPHSDTKLTKGMQPIVNQPGTAANSKHPPNDNVRKRIEKIKSDTLGSVPSVGSPTTKPTAIDLGALSEHRQDAEMHGLVDGDAKGGGSSSVDESLVPTSA